MESGDISARGCSTNILLCMRGCGTVSLSSLTISLPYSSMSISIMRSWYVPPSDFTVRPSSRSISSVASRTCSGESSVLNITAQFRKLLLLSNPHGSVSMNDEAAKHLPNASDSFSIARVRLSFLSPMFVPNPRHIVVFKFISL